MPPSKIKVERANLGPGVYGEAYADERLIRINPEMHKTERALLDTLTHEALHVAAPELTEQQVRRCAREVARVLWAEHWRRIRL